MACPGLRDDSTAAPRGAAVLLSGIRAEGADLSIPAQVRGSSANPVPSAELRS